MLKRLMVVLVVLVLLVLTGLGGYYLGFQNGSSQNRPLYSSNPTQTSLKAGPDSIIKNQFATAVGEVVKADQSTVTIKGSNEQQVTYSYSSPTLIRRATKNLPASRSASTPPASPPSIDPAEIKQGDMVTIFLELKNNKYLISSLEIASKELSPTLNPTPK